MSGAKDEGYRADVDGLRAVAVLAVIGFHAFPAYVPGGFVGVDVFFVISGYLITGILQRALDAGTFSITAFYARRIRRIFPALIVVLIATLAVGWFVLLPERYANLGTHVTGASAFVANFVSWSEAGYFDSAALEKPLLHLWSLGIEEQFYLVWPALLWLVARLRLPPVTALSAVAAASLALGIALTSRAPDAAFYLPLSRMWELAIGGLLALSGKTFGGAALGAVGLAAIALSVAVFDGGVPYPGWRALVPTLGACAIIASGPASALHRRVLGAAPVVAIGLISYPLYLWHWLLLAFGLSAPLAIALSFVLAAATYWLVERPIRSRRATSRQALLLLGGLCVTAVAGRLIVMLDGVPGRYPAPVQALLAYRYDYLSDAHAGTCWLSKTAPADGFAPECFPAPNGAKPALFVWGDSHAGRLRPGLERVDGTVFAIGSATRDVCPPSLTAEPACRASNEHVLAQIERTRPLVVILFAHWNAVPRETVDGAVELASRIVRAGPRVIVLGPAPQWTKNLPVAMYEAWRGGSMDREVPRRLASHLVAGVTDVDRRMAALPWPRGVRYVSVIDQLCDPAGCLTYVPGSATELMAYDYGHLTTPGATVLARALALYGGAP